MSQLHIHSSYNGNAEPSSVEMSDSSQGSGQDAHHRGGCIESGCGEHEADTKQRILQQREREIRAIHASPYLTNQEKLRETQRLLSAQWLDQQAQSINEAFVQDGQFEPTFTADSQNTTFGCKHYMRLCKLKAACCEKLFTCRFCHDESSDHSMDRFATEEVWCMSCRTLQPKGASCQTCGVSFAHYYCSVCGFYDNDPNKHIYHCAKCGMCRIGKGEGVDNFHCDKCKACVALESKSRHHCLERSLDANCPICSGYLFTSTEPVVFMRCGHAMHTQCFEQYTKTNYVCPLCSKSLSDMKAFYSRLDEVLANERLPDEYRSMRSHILCNDCGERSHARFHFVYHKCNKCEGYNTRVLETYRNVQAMH